MSWRQLRAGEQADLLRISRKDTKISWAHSDFIPRHQYTRGMTLRLFRSGMVGTAYVSGHNNTTRLFDMARRTMLAPSNIQQLPSAPSMRRQNIYSEGVALAGIDYLSTVLKQVVRDVREQVPKQTSISAVLERAVLNTDLQNSNGFSGSYQKTLTSLAVSASWALPGGQSLFFELGTANGSWPDYGHFPEQISKRLRWAATISSLPTGYYPVLLSPRAALPFWEWLLSWRAQGGSVLPQPISLESRFIDIKEDADLPWGVGTVPFDDEGVECQTKSLICGGLRRTSLLTLEDASRLKCSPTGNGFRDFDCAPVATPTNLIVALGKGNPEIWANHLKEAILVDQWFGEQSISRNGDFAFSLDLAFAVGANGVKGCLKGMVLGNAFGLFENISTLGSDAQYIGNRIYAPSIWVSSLYYRA